jgi:hypothetical protein
MAQFENPSPTEDADTREIVRCILKVQDRFATEEHRPLARGTHAKGICARAVFEIFDLHRTLHDPVLAMRLARGPYAEPGQYPAVVRFANAESRVRPDAKSDVRAMSFSVTLPPADAGGAPRRYDFSMNNAPTFPINDAHDFAVLLRVLGASGTRQRLRALFGLSFAEFRGLLKTIVRGARQKRRGRTPYQSMRYWSTVPFSHGADEVVKYTAIPARRNPSGPLNGGPMELRDELMRHLVEDARMSVFDFGVQLLDAERMTHGGRRREPSFWVENASVDWNEEQAPFHRVGRLTLLPASQLSAAEGEAEYIDVTEHCAEGSRPLGSINRTRRAAEQRSREARQEERPGAGVQVVTRSAAAGLPLVGGAIRTARRAGAVRVGTVAKVGAWTALIGFLLISALSLGTMRYIQSGRAMLPAEPADVILYPDQGWGPGLDVAGRETYYYTSQGAGLRGMRYSWFVHLEMPWGRGRFADPAVLRRYGFIVDAQTDRNPDRLPVGFTRHFDRQLNENVLSITCAACHTGQLHVTTGGRTTAVRIDGGQALHAFTDASFGHFLPTMLAALTSTAANPLKFDRFARRVLGPDYPEGRWKLHRELREVIGTFGGIAWNERGLYPTEEGYGRTDALARIANTVFGENLDHANLGVGNAPVSYPPVWNIWKFDWVQYNASVSQPMARNIGEALGVGATYALVNRYGGALPPDERFRSSAMLENLHTIETTLQKLQPPAWPESVMGTVDRALAEQGRQLFNRHCIGCHGPHEASPAVKARNAPLKGPDDPEWLMKILCVDDIGTDPHAAVNFAHAMVDITRTGMTAADLRAVAGRNLQLQRQREMAMLDAGIDTLRSQLARIPAAAGPADPRTQLEAQLVSLQRQRDGLDDAMQQQLSSLDPQRIPVGLALSYFGTMIREQAYRDLGIPPSRRDTLDGFGIADLPQVVAGYKPRPLAGIWATPPFLHNGSVPTVYDLLSPVAERPATFAMGSREFDPVRMGLKQPASGRWFTFDTSRPGNYNTGHEFNAGYVEWTPGSPPQGGLIGPLLSHDERMAIIEHLKIRDDDAEAVLSDDHPPPACPAPPAPVRRASSGR